MAATGCGVGVGCALALASVAMSVDQLETGLDNAGAVFEAEDSTYVQMLMGLGAGEDLARSIEFWTGAGLALGDFALVDSTLASRRWILERRLRHDFPEKRARPRRGHALSCLSVKDSGGRTLLTCHKSGCAAPEIFKELKGRGLVSGHGDAAQRPAAEIERVRKERRAQRLKTLRFCDDIFSQAVPITGTPAETYLAGRGIAVQGQKMRETLRFHPNLKHSGTGEYHPAMVACLPGPKGEPLGIHRTFLRSDGSSKPNKVFHVSSGGGKHRLYQIDRDRLDGWADGPET